MKQIKGVRVRGNKIEVLTRQKDAWGKPCKRYDAVKIKPPYGKEQIEEAYNEGIKLKGIQEKDIKINGHKSEVIKKVQVVARLKDTLDDLFTKRWAGKASEDTVKIYIKDIYAVFPLDIQLRDMQTELWFEQFKSECKKLIIDRPANNLSTFNTRTINKRLSILRETFRHAIKNKTLLSEELLDPTAKDMGWTNETVVEPQHKPALTNQEVSDVIAEAMLDREVEFADAFAWLVDTGMRHETEFRKFTIDNIDFKKMTICFFREKTQEWSQHINLTLRCQEIAKRYRPIAMKREDRRMFPNMTKSKVRTLFARYGKRLSLKNFTPYCTKHTFITNLSLKVSPKIISAIAGIAVETALTYYNQVKPSEIKKAMATLNDDSSVVSMMGHNRKVEKIK